MDFFKQHWFKFFLVLPFIPVVILIYSLDRFSGIDDRLKFFTALTLVMISLFLHILGLYFELNKGNLENKKIQFNISGFKFGIAEVARVLLSIIILVFSYSVLNYAIISMRVANAVDNISIAPELPTHQGYSLVTMSDFEVSNQGNYGRIGLLRILDETKENALEGFLEEQDFILNPIPTHFDSPVEMLNALYDDEIDAIIIGSNFIHVFDELEKFENIATDTQILSQFDIEVQQNERAQLNPQEPFSILLLGLNQNDQELTSGTINTFMLLTVNLEELSFTITSIPRDSYVMIPSWGVYDKLSHTNVGGNDCAIGAIEAMFEMEIPYYVKLNFTGFMELIDILGGIEVDVPFAFEEQDSERRFGEHLIRLEAGQQRLNAEQALALARHRGKTGQSVMTGDDFTRVEHQQIIFKAMLKEMLEQSEGINDFLPLIEVLGQHIETNLSFHEIMEMAQYMVGLRSGRTGGELMTDMHFINMVILGHTTTIDVRHYGHLWVSFPYHELIAEARRRMMINLGLEQPEFNFTFEFDGFAKTDYQWSIATDEIQDVEGLYVENQEEISSADLPYLLD